MAVLRSLGFRYVVTIASSCGVSKTYTKTQAEAVSLITDTNSVFFGGSVSEI